MATMPASGTIVRLLERLFGNRHRDTSREVSQDIAVQARRAQEQRQAADVVAAAWEQTERDARQASRLAWEDLVESPPARHQGGRL